MGPLILRPSSCRSSCLRVCHVVRETNFKRNYCSIVKDRMALTSEFEVEEVEAHKEKATTVYLTKLGSVNDSVGCVGLDFLELVPKVRGGRKGPRSRETAVIAGICLAEPRKTVDSQQLKTSADCFTFSQHAWNGLAIQLEASIIASVQEWILNAEEQAFPHSLLLLKCLHARSRLFQKHRHITSRSYLALAPQSLIQCHCSKRFAVASSDFQSSSVGRFST
jgi:hypothetical protein